MLLGDTPEMPDESSPDGLAELVRSTYVSLNRRDFDSVTAMFGPDSVWDVSRWGLGSHWGREQIRHFLEDWFGSLDRYEVRLEAVHPLGNGVIWVEVVQLAHRSGSRSLLRVPSAPVFQWAHGRIASVTVYPDAEEARSAAELLAGRAAAERLADGTG